MSVKSKAFSDPARWVCLYPGSIDSNKKLEEGRRIPKDKAVESPTAQEICDILQHAGLNCDINKRVMHPREPSREPNTNGRVKVQLKNDDGSLFDQRFAKRRDLLIYAASLIPQLKSRQADAAQSTSQPAATNGGKKKRR